MKERHIPERTCRGCGKKRPQRDLKRLIMQDGRLTVDEQRRLPGRGVYCCDNDDCRKRLEKNKKMLKRALRLDA